MGVRKAFEKTKLVAGESKAHFVIHLDHGPWDECLEAIKLGFNSIMCDFAHLPFEGNICMTKRVVEIAHDFGIPLVLHGASGIPADEVQAAQKAGVHKFNADTDLRHAFREGMLDVWSKGDRQLEDAMTEGRSRMIKATIEKMQLYGCAGKV